MRVIAKNDFHGTEANLRSDGRVTPERAHKLRRQLCAADCTCFMTHTKFFEHEPGYRNSENRMLPLYAREDSEGGIILER